MDRATIAVSGEAEIIGLHRFFEQWFRGELPDTDEAFMRFERALAPEFEIVTPGGEVMGRDAILSSVRRGYGAEREAKIWIERIRWRWVGEETAMATYEEWQERDGEKRGRLSSALFRAESDDHSTPGALTWLHLHETWLGEENK